MPEMRKNPHNGKWVIFAPERAKRPHSNSPLDFKDGDNRHYCPECCFCYGNEAITPHEILVYGRKESAQNSTGWKLRVIPNKYPSVDMQESFEENKQSYFQVSAYAQGRAEVIIEVPHHSKNMANYSQTEMELVIKSYKERFKAIAKMRGIKYVIVFKNNGRKAGASLSHPHSQIIGIPVIPPLAEQEFDEAKKHFVKKSSCLYCNMISEELNHKKRVVLENEDFLAFLPYAPKTPCETWILPKKHSSRFEEITDLQIERLANLWKTIMGKIDSALNSPPYNYFIHTAPVNSNRKEKEENYFHWHIEIVPRAFSEAGFEMGTGIYVNISTPEENAQKLRRL